MDANTEERTAPLPTPDGTAVFLDIDGTLVGFEDDPAAVRADAALCRLLQDVGAAVGGALALISGRAIRDIDALFDPVRFVAAGQHGTERRTSDGRIHRHASPAVPLRRAAAVLDDLAQAHAGLLVENKGTSLALHYRRRPDLRELARRETAALVAALGDEFELQAGKSVCEIKPSGRDKGIAIAEYLEEAPFAGRSSVFIGDDHSDELGFAMVNRLGGQSIKVGAGATCARWRLADVAAVRNWLQRLAAAPPKKE